MTCPHCKTSRLYRVDCAHSVYAHIECACGWRGPDFSIGLLWQEDVAALPVVSR